MSKRVRKGEARARLLKTLLSANSSVAQVLATYLGIAGVERAFAGDGTPAAAAPAEGAREAGEQPVAEGQAEAPAGDVLAAQLAALSNAELQALVAELEALAAQAQLPVTDAVPRIVSLEDSATLAKVVLAAKAAAASGQGAFTGKKITVAANGDKATDAKIDAKAIGGESALDMAAPWLFGAQILGLGALVASDNSDGSDAPATGSQRDLVSPVGLKLVDNGASTTDGVVFASSITSLLGNVEAGARIEYRQTDGSFSTTAPALREGVNVITVRQVDAAGNIGPATELKFWNIPGADASAPSLSETLAAELLADGSFSLANAGDVTLHVSGTSLSDNALTYSGLAGLGVDVIQADASNRIHVELGGTGTVSGALPTFSGATAGADPTVTLHLDAAQAGQIGFAASRASALHDAGVDFLHADAALNLTEAQALQLMDGGGLPDSNALPELAFDRSSDVTVTVQGTSLADSKLTLSELTLLGVDHVQSDASGKINLALGGTAGLGTATLPDFRGVSGADPTVTLHLDATQSSQIGFAATHASELHDAGVDFLHASAALSLSEAQALQLMDGSAGVPDSNALPELAFDASSDVTVTVHGTSLADSKLTLADLTHLGVDHISSDGGSINIDLGDAADLAGQVANVPTAAASDFVTLNVGFSDFVNANQEIDDIAGRLNVDRLNVEVSKTDVTSGDTFADVLRDLGVTPTTPASELADALKAVGIDQLTLDTDLALGGSYEAQAQALTQAGVLRYEVADTLVELGQLDAAAVQEQLSTQPTTPVQVVADLGFDFDGNDVATQDQVQQIQDLLSTLDGLAVNFEAADDVTLHLNVESVGVDQATADQIQDVLTSLGIDHLENADGTKVDVIGLNGIDDDIFRP